MAFKPCVGCGRLTSGSRCDACDLKLPPKERGYDYAWSKLSKRARQRQPWCSRCGATEGLQLHHEAAAWEAIAEGRRLTMKDAAAGLLSVVCGPCNRDLGPARSMVDKGLGDVLPGHRRRTCKVPH